MNTPKGQKNRSTLGVIGGGQLGRMTALAAARLGFRVHVFTPEPDGPASQVSARTTVAAYDDRPALEAFAQDVDVITLEFENIPADTLLYLAERCPVRPNARALEISQDRRLEKNFFASLGIETAPWVAVNSADDLRLGLKTLGGAAILKTCRLGYDGKGQIRLTQDSDADAAWNLIGKVPCLLERKVDFDFELSCGVARTLGGKTAAFDPALNVHRDGILHTSTVPAPGLTVDAILQVQEITARAAEKLDLVGLLTIEFFRTKDGVLIANEMAPRPHNSAHWTMDACHTDQFEQLVRCVFDLPLGDPGRYRAVRMTNLIGDDIFKVPAYLGHAGARLHLYGKSECRKGRKMGHVNELL